MELNIIVLEDNYILVYGEGNIMEAIYNYQYLDKLNIEKFREQEKKNYFIEKELEVRNVKNAVILPYKSDENKFAGGGVMDENGNYVALSAQRIVGAEMNHGYPCDVIRKIDDTVIWFGAFHKHWGHFLNEMVGRCWYFSEKEVDISSLKIAYIRKNDSCERPIEGNYLEFLELLGIQKEQLIEVNEPTQFAVVIVPELSCRGGGFYSKEFVRTFNTVRDHNSIPGCKSEKLYFTRLKSKAFRSTELGEKRIKKIYEKNHHRVLAPEHCTLREQIAYIKNCEEMTVVAGTLPHNILFAQDGIKITILNRTGETNGYQPLINQVRDANVTYIDTHITLLPVFANGPFLLQVTDNLLHYLQDRQMWMPSKIESVIGIHMKLMWYFMCYLENMTESQIEKWDLKEKYGAYILDNYSYYRSRIPLYDKKNVRKLRRIFYVLARIFE